MFSIILKSSMIQFFSAGSIIFGLYHLFGDKEEQNKNQIHITIGQQKNIEALLTRTKQRPPTKEELQNAVEENIDEIIFYKEAVAMGLDRDDDVVRRRLSQKLKFIIGDLNVNEPNEEQLVEFYENNKDKYKLDGNYMFNQIYFESLPKNPQAILQEIKKGENLKTIGDIIDIPYGFKNATSKRVQQTFGTQFDIALQEATLNEWVGPVESAYGYHFIRVLDRQDASYPPIDEILTKLTNDLRWQQQNEAKSNFLKEMRKKYTIVIEQDKG